MFWSCRIPCESLYLLQEAKSAALGPKHDTSRLASTVGEPWLSVVTQEADKARESGWFWEYDLKHVSVRLSAGCPPSWLNKAAP